MITVNTAKDVVSISNEIAKYRQAISVIKKEAKTFITFHSIPPVHLDTHSIERDILINALENKVNNLVEQLNNLGFIE